MAPVRTKAFAAPMAKSKMGFGAGPSGRIRIFVLLTSWGQGLRTEPRGRVTDGGLGGLLTAVEG